MIKFYDIAIIGLGPAGSTLVRFCPNNLKIIAFDKKSDVIDNSDNSSFRKPCGGLLAPDAQKSLSRFGLTLPKSVLVEPLTFNVKTVDLKAKLTRHYQRFYMNMDRHKFDLWLKSLIPPKIEKVSESVVKSLEKTKDGWLITYSQNGKTMQISAKFIVGADGANSIVRRTVFGEKKIRTYLSIQEWYKSDSEKSSGYASIFDPRATDCYAWGLSKQEYYILGGAFEVKSAKQKFRELKQRLADTGFFGMGIDVEKPVKTEACLVLRPKNPFQFCLCRDNAFLIGEAAGFISPSSLEGISYAFESGYALGKVFCENIKNPEKYQKAYKKSTAKIRFKLILKLLKCPFIYNRLLRFIIMKTGISAVEII